MVMPSQTELERILQRLERRLEGKTQYRRDAIRDARDVQTLLDQRYIDQPHADLLRELIAERAEREHKAYRQQLANEKFERDVQQSKGLAFWLLIFTVLLTLIMLSRCT